MKRETLLDLLLLIAILFIMLFISVRGHAETAFVVTNVSKQGPHQQSIYNALDFITAHADSKCSQALPGLATMIAALEGDRHNEATILIGHGTYNAMTGAFTGNDGSVPEGYFITVNDASTFFTDAVPGHPNQYLMVALRYRGGTPQSQVFVLMHELGHVLEAPGFLADYNSIDNVMHNDSIIEKSCHAVIDAAGNRGSF
jgi:predicted Zn-dependent protease